MSFFDDVMPEWRLVTLLDGRVETVYASPVSIMDDTDRPLQARPVVSVSAGTKVEIHPRSALYMTGYREAILLGVTRKGNPVIKVIKGHSATFQDPTLVVDARNLVVNVGTRRWLHGNKKRDGSVW